MGSGWGMQEGRKHRKREMGVGKGWIGDKNEGGRGKGEREKGE